MTLALQKQAQITVTIRNKQNKAAIYKSAISVWHARSCADVSISHTLWFVLSLSQALGLWEANDAFHGGVDESHLRMRAAPLGVALRVASAAASSPAMTSLSFTPCTGRHAADA